jgi:hypothetical protein
MLEQDGFRQWLLPHLIGESVVTWRNEGSDFPPGRLDVVTYLPGPQVARNGFVLDTDLYVCDGEKVAAVPLAQLYVM